MRYLLRPPSTPWITFDKEQQGEILTSSRSSVIDAPGLFPDASAAIAAANGVAIQEPAVPAVEPSNVVVSSDIQPPGGATDDEHPHDVTHDEPHVPVAAPKHILLAVGGTIGLAALILIAVFAFGGKKDIAKTAAATATTPANTTPAFVEPPPPQLDVAPVPAPPSTAEAKPEKTGWAKLTIRGQAKSHRVYLDGKMLLGQGQRTFMIRCGDHTIAVGNKTDAKDVDVPCNGEYVVSK